MNHIFPTRAPARPQRIRWGILLASSIAASWVFIPFTATAQKSETPVAKEGQTTAQTLPQPLAAFSGFAEKLEAFNRAAVALSVSKSRDIPVTDLKQFEPKTPGSATVIELGKGKVLQIKTRPGVAELVAVGPKLTGEVFVEIECRTDAPTPSDLSIVMDGVSQGPAFRFGAYTNTQNILYHQSSVITRPGNVKTPLYSRANVRPSLKVEPERWYKVRLVISKAAVQAFVDDQMIGTVGMGKAYDFAQERQPRLYFASGTTFVRRVTIGTPISLEDLAPEERQKMLDQTLGDESKKLEEKIAGLFAAMDDPNYPVREAATNILLRAAPLAAPQLRKLMESATPEQEARLRRVFNESGLPLRVEVDPATTQTQTAPAGQGVIDIHNNKNSR